MHSTLAVRVRKPRLADTEPLGTPLGRVGWLLGQLGHYDAEELPEILRHCRDHRTAHGCALIAHSDRQAVDDLLEPLRRGIA